MIRTRERVVLDEASISSSYSEDAYVRQNRPRSVLCLPIVQQTKLIGALYLENNLTPGAFTSERVAVLELPASQAAISLENARLYSDLQRIHPDDWAFVKETIDRAARETTNFDFEHRLLMPDGAVKHLHVIAHFLQNSSDNLEFVGAVMDVTSTKHGEVALRQAQADLAHVSR